MNNVDVASLLVQLYHRAGGRGIARASEMLQRIADNGSHLLRIKAFPTGFEVAALEALAKEATQIDKELRLDLLALACEAGFSMLASALLAAGIAWRESDTYQCMVLAIRAGRPATLSLLLQAGIDASLRGECGTPLLTHAIAAGDAVIVRMLREAGARADCEGSALYAAVATNQLEMIRMCTDDGALSTALGDALDQAAIAGQREAVLQLLKAGAPLDPALLHATQRGDSEMANLLCMARAGQLLASGAVDATQS